jgi:hypothetical protein
LENTMTLLFSMALSITTLAVADIAVVMLC